MNLKRSYSNSVKAKAIEMYASGLVTIAEVSQSIGCSKSTIQNWTDKYFGKNEKNIFGLKSKV